MIWLWLSIISALFASGAFLTRKKLASFYGIENIINLFSFLFSGLLLLISFSLVSTFPHPNDLNFFFWLPTIIHAIIEAIAAWFLLRALYYEDAILVATSLGLVRIFVLINGMIFLDEFPSLLNIIALLVIISGIILVRLNGNSISEFKYGNGFKYLLGTIFFWSFTPILRKFALASVSHITLSPYFLEVF